VTLIRPIPTLGVLRAAPHTRKADIRPNGVGQLSADSVAKLAKCRATDFPRKKPKQAMIADQCASNPLPESPVSLTHGGVVPHIIIRSSRLRLGEFEFPCRKKTFATLSAKTSRLSRVSRSLELRATSHWKRPPLQNLAGDRVDANLLMMFCILKQNFPYHAPAHLF
jgi:hypothetical protein